MDTSITHKKCLQGDPLPKDVQTRRLDSNGEDDRLDTATSVALVGASADSVSRYGSGIKEHLVAYCGVDHENGQVLKRGLKSISESKVDARYKDSNLKQQAGFAAETKEVARQRAEQAIAGKKPSVVRTDDIPGHVNDQLFDITCKVDSNGNPVPGSSAQMKFIGASPHAAVEKMLGKDYQKYCDNNCKMMVPSDYYDGMKIDLQKRMDDLREQIDYLERQGRSDIAVQKRALLDKCRKLHQNLQKSSVSNSEAIEARVAPKWSTAKDVSRIAHRAGVEQAKVGATYGGGVSFVKNAIAVFNGDKTTKEAALDIARDTAGAAGRSYAVAFGGSLTKGCMQNASSKTVRSLAKSNLPGVIATSAIEATKTLSRFFQGEIDGSQCLSELGEKGYGMVNSALYAAVGQTLIPIPVVGAFVGSMVGYALSSASYKILFYSLREAKVAHEERIRVEAECAEMRAMLEEYRLRLEAKIDKYLKDKRELFFLVFTEIKQSLQIGDVDGYIGGMNKITESFGGKPLFRDMAELDRLMESADPIIL